MLRKLILTVLVLCISLCAFASPFDFSNAQEVKDGEFPKWALDLRRGEIIFFGSLALTMPAVGLVGTVIGLDLAFWQSFIYAGGLSAVIAITDYILGI